MSPASEPHRTTPSQPAVNFEEKLVRKGLRERLLVIEPNHAHGRTFLDELNARARGVGLWGACVPSS